MHKVVCLFHLVGVGVRTNSLSSHTRYNIDVTTVVLKSLLGSSSRLLLSLFLLFDLRRLVLNLTGTSERSVNFTHLELFELSERRGKQTIENQGEKDRTYNGKI
jgi:hypothetical protein